jgi:hypothetical protein
MIGQKLKASKVSKVMPKNVVAINDKLQLGDDQLTPGQINGHFGLINTIIAHDRYSRTIEGAMGLINSVCLYFGSGRVLSPDIITSIGEYLRNDTYYYYSKKDFDQNPIVKRDIKRVIEMGFKFNPSYSMHLMKSHQDLIEPIMKTYENIIDYEFLQRVDAKDMNDELMMLLINHKKIRIQFTPQQRDIYMNDTKSNSTIIFSLLDDPTVLITPEFTQVVAKHHSIALFKRTILNGGILDSEILNVACSSTVDRYEKVKFILDNKIEPTKEAFNTIIEDSEEINHKQQRNARVNESHGSTAVANLFADYGYVISYDDLKNALKKSIIIKNVERFNIKFDSTYLHICSEIGMYPYKTSDVSPDITCLLNECKKPGNLSNIKKVTNDNKLTPSAACVQEACKHRANVQTLKFLISKGGRVDFNCLKNIIGTLYNKTLNFVLEEYEKNNTSTLRHVKLEKVPAKDVGDVDSDLDVDSDPDSDVDAECGCRCMGKGKCGCKTKTCICRTRKVPLESSDDDNDSDEDDDIPVVKQKKVVAVKAIPSKALSVKVKNIPVPIVIKTISDPKNTPIEEEKSPARLLSNIPKDVSTREAVYDKIPVSIRKLLELTPKNKTMNYVDFRRTLLEYLNDNDMMLNKVITVKSPLLYNGSSNVPFKEINEWAYGLLSPDTKNENIKKKSTTKVKDGDSDNENPTTILDICDDSDDDTALNDRRTRRVVSKTKTMKTKVDTETEDGVVEEETPKKGTVKAKTTKTIAKTKTTKIVSKKTVKTNAKVSDDEDDEEPIVVKKVKANTKTSSVKKSATKTKSNVNESELVVF